MDFNKLLQQQAQPAPIVPRELYASLPEKARGYGYLRDVQAEVLEAWHLRRAERDMVIKVNTGAGKTIDGLVILQSYLNAGEGPALYVAPDKYLVEQVRREAERIRIPTIDNPDDPKYLAGDVIAVVNASKLFTGLSVFSDARPSWRSRVPIKSVVIDDAHAALTTMRQHLALSIPRADEAYDALLNLFEDDLRQQAPNDLLDVQDASLAALARISFWAWQSKVESVRKLLHKNRDSEAIKYAWPAVSEVLELCRAVFTGNAVTITPTLPPIRHITGFAEAAHRIYLTATLADDSVLVSEFGADADSVSKRITPLTAGDIGERMILAPLEMNPGLKPERVRRAVADLARDYNVVVLAPSAPAAKAWEVFTNRIIYAPDVAATVDGLRSGKHIGLVVFVNKYDGIDLPEDACRVLVIDGLPEAQSAEDRVESQLRKHARFGDDRQIQRIEQGMGRGVRSNEDHCVVLLLGARLSQLVIGSDSLARFSPATRAQLELSRTVAGGLQDAPLEDILQVARQALDRDENWVRLAKLKLANIEPPTSNVSTTAIERRRAFEAAIDHNYRDAEHHMSAAVASSSDQAEQGWLLEQQASYINLTDPVRAQTTLVSARKKNRAVLRPLSGISYTRLPASADQAQRVIEFAANNYSSPAELRLGFQAVLDDLVFDPERTEAFEEAMRGLAEHIGLSSQRPEFELREGPDVLWALGELRYWVIEVKSGVTGSLIHKRDANQLSGSMNWFAKRYDPTTKATPVMVHPVRKLAPDASAPDAMCILDEDGLIKLKTSVTKLAEALAAAPTNSIESVNALLQGHRLQPGNLSGYLKTVR